MPDCWGPAPGVGSTPKKCQGIHQDALLQHRWGCRQYNCHETQTHTHTHTPCPVFLASSKSSWIHFGHSIWVQFWHCTCNQINKINWSCLCLLLEKFNCSWKQTTEEKLFHAFYKQTKTKSMFALGLDYSLTLPTKCHHLDITSISNLAHPLIPRHILHFCPGVQGLLRSINEHKITMKQLTCRATSHKQAGELKNTCMVLKR